ncbi:hypothetical protein Ancab_014531 [Ancistrocladus abbreviatus]
MPLEYLPYKEDVLVFVSIEVAGEIKYWRNSIVGYVLGTEVSLVAMEQFVKHQWSSLAMPMVAEDLAIVPTWAFIVLGSEGLKQVVVFEWMPIQCKNCCLWGHNEAKCRKLLKVEKVWVPKCGPGPVGEELMAISVTVSSQGGTGISGVLAEGAVEEMDRVEFLHVPR